MCLRGVKPLRLTMGGSHQKNIPKSKHKQALGRTRKQSGEGVPVLLLHGQRELTTRLNLPEWRVYVKD